MDKRLLCVQLKSNPMNYTSIAYPIDELNLPEWFKESSICKQRNGTKDNRSKG